MDRPFELVQYPFKVHDQSDLLLYRSGDDFEMRFSKEVFSKRVASTHVNPCKNYIELEITDDEIAVI